MLATKSHQKYPCWLIKHLWVQSGPLLARVGPPDWNLISSAPWFCPPEKLIILAQLLVSPVCLPKRVHHCLLSATPVHVSILFVQLVRFSLPVSRLLGCGPPEGRAVSL